MSRARPLLVLTLLAAICFYCGTKLYDVHSKRRADAISHLASLPEPLARAAVFEFSGIASDHLMLKALTFLGQLLIDNETASKEDWDAIYRILKQCINLDSRFIDPYVLAQMTLPSDAGMVKETNELLEKGAEVLTNDYRLHFFLWHNYVTYFNDQVSAAKHLEKAARIPGAPNYFTTLAARTNLYAGNIYAAVVYLEETLRETQDQAMRRFLSIRLEALKRIGFLEMKIQEFRKLYAKSPEKLQDLIDGGVISKIPSDPYGGEFYLLENGRVYTTSKLVLPKKPSK